MKTIIIFLAILVTFSNVNSQWTEYSSGIPSSVFVQSLHSSGAILYAGTSNGVFLSANNGESWSQILSNTGTIQSITSQGSYVYAGSSGLGVYITSNGGTSWSTALGSVTVWSLDTYANNVYAVVWADRVWKTTNSGALWQPISPGGNVKSVAVYEPYIFAGFQNYTTGGNGGVHYSTNNGANWSIAIPGKEVKVVICRDEFVVAGALDDTSRSGGVYVSQDHALNWVRTSLDSVPVQALEILSNSVIAGIDNHYYPGFQNYAGVWVSTNKGQSWAQRNEGLIGLTNRAIAAIKIHSGYAFVAVSGGKVYRRPVDQIIGIRNISSSVPDKLTLDQNYPNPFNSSTKIRFQISLRSEVSMTVYDISGKKVDAPVNETLSPGSYELTYDASMLPSGIYFYELRMGDLMHVNKMTVLK
jgi:hypothetical protein